MNSVKNVIMKTAALTVLAILPVLAKAETQTPGAKLAAQFEAMTIPAQDLLNNSKSPSVADNDVLLGFSIGLPPSSEGIPTGEILVDDEFLNSAYTTSTLISRAMLDARQLPMGQKILHFQNAVVDVLRRSNQDPTEQQVRITLNRAVDVVNNMISVAGANPELIAQIAANFYHQSFALALSFANNPSHLRTWDNFRVIDHIRFNPIADFGFAYSTLLWRHQASLVSNTAKAIILMKLIGYLGWDFNMDMRRREPALREVIADVYKLQTRDINYRNIINSLKQNQEPAAADVAALRVKVYRIWSGLPSRLGSVPR